MSSYNKVVLVGRLTRDPEQKNTESGKVKTTFSMAVDRPTSDKQTDFFNVVTWGKIAETCGKYLAKGKLVLVEGSIQNRTYEADGVEKKVTEIVAWEMRMLGSKEGGNGGNGEQPTPPQSNRPQPTHVQPAAAPTTAQTAQQQTAQQTYDNQDSMDDIAF